MENIHDNRTSVYQRHINFGLYNINGAIGIARKVAKQYEFQFDSRGFARGILTMLRRLRFWINPKP